MPKMPRSIQDWELFNGVPGNANAARALTAALKKAEKALRKGEGDPEQMYEKYIWKVACKHSNTGATDTEPRAHALSYLDKVADEVCSKIRGW